VSEKESCKWRQSINQKKSIKWQTDTQ